MTERKPFTPFRPEPRDGFPGHVMPSSVPEGLKLELSRSPIVPGKEAEFEEWMAALSDRYDEHEGALSNERQVFGATFEHREADGTLWMYHVSLMGTESGGLDESRPLDALHVAYSRRVKTPGWEDLIPKFMLTPQHRGLRTSARESHVSDRFSLIWRTILFLITFVLDHVDSAVTRVFRRCFPTRLIDGDFTAFRSSRPGVGRRSFPDTGLSVTFPSIGPQPPVPA